MGTRMRQKRGWFHVGTGLAILSILLGSGLVGKLHAGTTDTVGLKVTVSISLSVSVGTSAYSFGNSMAANETVISTGAIPVTNDSSGLLEDLQIDGSDTGNWTAHATTNTTTNNFNLRVLISTHSDSAPVYGDFESLSNGLTDSAAQNLTNGNYGWYANGSGDDVAANGKRYLWFRFIAPATISAGNNTEQTVTVTLTAAASSTY